MYKRYKAPFGAVVWSYIVWYGKQIKRAKNDILAGLAFGCLLVFLPIIAGFIIG